MARHLPAVIVGFLVAGTLLAGCDGKDKPNASQQRERMGRDINAQMDKIAAELAAEEAANNPFDPAARAALAATITPLTDGDMLPAVSLEAFFDGNRDNGSIAPNLSEHPGPAHFHATLKAIRERDDVQDVVVPIAEFVPQDAGSWPYAATVLVFTTASVEDIEGAVASLHPDEVAEYDDPELPPGSPRPETWHRVVRLWWD